MTLADFLLVVWVGLWAVQGYFRGFAAQTLSLAGLSVGALAGSWILPHLVPGDGRSGWASVLGALAGALVLGFAAGTLVESAQRLLIQRPSLRTLNALGGLAGGGVIGLALAWLLVVLFLHQPSLGLRSAVQDAELLPRLVRAVPPDGLLQAIDRIDALPLLPGANDRLPPPDPSVLQSDGAQVASASVVKIEGTSCGLGTQGSGWVVSRNLIATNAHVIAGQQDTNVLVPNGPTLPARVVSVDATNDVALLLVRSLPTRPLATDQSGRFPRPVVFLGYPRDGALTATAGTAGEPRKVLAPDAYRRKARPRTVVPLRGPVEPGQSGGPVVDARGRVVAMIFGGTEEGRGGFGVPVELVLRALERRLRPVSTGPCVG